MTFVSDNYTRDLDFVEHIIQQKALFLSKSTGDSYEDCERYARDTINKKLESDDIPVAVFNQRDISTGDRVRRKMKVHDHIQHLVSKDLIITPCISTYVHPKIKKSILSEFVDINVASRALVKTRAFKERAAGEHDKADNSNLEQTNIKLDNNAVSGAFLAKSSILYNPSNHNALTSTTRLITSIANTSNEKLIAGNRHYYSTTAIMGNILATLQSLSHIHFGKTSYDLMKTAIAEWKLHVCTVDDVMACIYRSSRLYMVYNDLDEVRTFLNNLDGVELSSIVYMGDLYHLRKHNPKLLYTFLDKLSTKVTSTEVVDVSKIHEYPEAIVMAAHQVCMFDIAGMGKDYERMQKEGVYSTLYHTVVNIHNTIQEYGSLLDTLFCTKNLPSNIADVQTMLRRCVPVSDTDSTCCSVDEWVIWYRNGLVFDEKSYGVASGLMLVAFEIIAHYLAVCSANIGVEEKNLRKLAVKNEFCWSTLALTANNTKHYYAGIVIQEGNVFPTDETILEVKGNHLKASTGDEGITKFITDLQKDLLTTVRSNKKIKLNDIIKRVADKEREIIQEVLSGDTKYFKGTSVKGKDSYKQSPDKSFYMTHVLWNTVFGPKYGNMPEPEYTVAQVTVTMNSKIDMQLWLDNIKDVEFKQRMIDFCKDNKKEVIKNFYIPTEKLAEHGGLPEELVPVVDITGFILVIFNSAYLTLETLGYTKKKGVLLSDLGY